MRDTTIVRLETIGFEAIALDEIDAMILRHPNGEADLIAEDSKGRLASVRWSYGSNQMRSGLHYASRWSSKSFGYVAEWRMSATVLTELEMMAAHR